MRKLILMILFFFSPLAFSAEESVTLEFAGVSAKLTADSVAMKNKDSGESLYVLKAPVLITTDFENAKISPQDDQVQINVELTGGGIKKFREYSAAHVGERLAILLNHEVVQAPIINQKIDKKFVIGKLTRSQAHDLAKTINKQK